jgi:hypothetical protein
MDLIVIITIVAVLFFVLRLVLRKVQIGVSTNAVYRQRSTVAVAGTATAALTSTAAAAAFARSGNAPSDDWLNDPAYWFMPGNIYYRDQYDDDSFSTSTDSGDDWYTDPIYSWMPGNIYHHDTSCSSIGSDFSSTDYITDPIYSYMPNNIFHHDDIMDITCSNTDFSSGTSSRCDDSWSSNDTTHDDWSTPSNSCNDNNNDD